MLGWILFAAEDKEIAGTNEKISDDGCVWVCWLGRSKEKVECEEFVEFWLEGVDNRTLCAVGVGGEERDRSR